MRHELILRQDDTLVLIIDFQEKLLAAFNDPEDILDNCIRLIKLARVLNLPIIWTEQYPRGLGQTADAVKAELSHMRPIEKLSFSCFGEPRFVDELSRHSSRQLIICGIETHICVEQTALDGIEMGYQMHIATDACGSRKTQDHTMGMQKMAGAGASLTCVEMAMYEILCRSDTKEFRDALAVVKQKQ
jgi:nicotinamidase-related amidase